MEMSLGQTDFILGGGVFILDAIGFLGGMVESLPFPHVWQCFLAADLMLLVVHFMAGTVGTMNFMDYLKVGLAAGIGCGIGALFATTISIYMMPLGGAVGAVLGYKKLVLNQ